MRKRFNDQLRIGVSARAVALLRTSRWGGRSAEVLGEQACGGADMIGVTVRALLEGAGCAAWPATVVLADELARVWQVTPPQGSTRLADLEGAAALRFQTLYGEGAAAWHITAGWDAARPFLAAAVPRALMHELEQACAGGALEIVPQFVAGYNQWRGALKAGVWYGQVQEGVLTLGALEQGTLRALRAHAIAPAPDAAWLDGHVAREALRLNLPAPARLLLSGQVPPAWQAHAGTLGQDDAKWSHAVRLAATGGRT